MLFQKLGGKFLYYYLNQISFSNIIEGIVLDKDPRHFPTLLISCVILSIVFFVIASIISSIHQRKLNSKKGSPPQSDIKPISDLTEEQQMERYLANNEQTIE
jgi:uncharacterized membrane protein